jgi:hypothetical protein
MLSILGAYFIDNWTNVAKGSSLTECQTQFRGVSMTEEEVAEEIVEELNEEVASADKTSSEATIDAKQKKLRVHIGNTSSWRSFTIWPSREL